MAEIKPTKIFIVDESQREAAEALAVETGATVEILNVPKEIHDYAKWRGLEKCFKNSLRPPVFEK
jgi:hypothetical protein